MFFFKGLLAILTVDHAPGISDGAASAYSQNVISYLTAWSLRRSGVGFIVMIAGLTS
jgi:hypothetical protein